MKKGLRGPSFFSLNSQEKESVMLSQKQLESDIFSKDWWKCKKVRRWQLTLQKLAVIIDFPTVKQGCILFPTLQNHSKIYLCLKSTEEKTVKIRFLHTQASLLINMLYGNREGLLSFQGLLPGLCVWYLFANLATCSSANMFLDTDVVGLGKNS